MINYSSLIGSIEIDQIMRLHGRNRNVIDNRLTRAKRYQLFLIDHQHWDAMVILTVFQLIQLWDCMVKTELWSIIYDHIFQLSIKMWHNDQLVVSTITQLLLLGEVDQKINGSFIEATIGVIKLGHSRTHLNYPFNLNPIRQGPRLRYFTLELKEIIQSYCIAYDQL